MKPHQQRMCPVIQRMVGDMKLRNHQATAVFPTFPSLRNSRSMHGFHQLGQSEGVRGSVGEGREKAKALTMKGFRLSEGAGT